jgi:phage shock protein PspC (stress-responsive transcriptional regulator)
MMNEKKLVRNMDRRMICGVCAGIADYLHVDVTVVRLVTVALACMQFGWVLYIAAAFLMPEGE